MPKNKKGIKAQGIKKSDNGRQNLQSAIEYLTTYGWALLLIAIAFAALYMLGIINPRSIVNNECLLPSGFGCQNAYMVPNGMIYMNVVQDLSYPINVTALGCVQNSSLATFSNMQKIYNPPSNQLLLPISYNAILSVQCYGSGGAIFSGNVGDLFQGIIIINYTNDLNGVPQTVYGKVAEKVV